MEGPSGSNSHIFNLDLFHTSRDALFKIQICLLRRLWLFAIFENRLFVVLGWWIVRYFQFSLDWLLWRLLVVILGKFRELPFLGGFLGFLDRLLLIQRFLHIFSILNRDLLLHLLVGNRRLFVDILRLLLRCGIHLNRGFLRLPNNFRFLFHGRGFEKLKHVGLLAFLRRAGDLFAHLIINLRCKIQINISNDY